MTDTALETANASIALLVDDDDPFRNRLARAFTTRGWQVLEAADAAGAHKHAEGHTVELAIVDLRLPGVGGLDIVQDLRQIDDGTIIIMLTGYGSIATALSATKLGANHYLSKPADADQILNCYYQIKQESDQADSAIVEVPSLARVEWEHIQRVLADCDGNISQASKLLGLHRRSLQRKLSKYAPTR